MEEIKKQMILLGWLLNTYVFIKNGKTVGKCEVSQGSEKINPKYTKIKEYTGYSEKEAFVKAISDILENHISFAADSKYLYQLVYEYKIEGGFK